MRPQSAALLFLGCALRALAAPSVIAYVGTGTEAPVNGIYAFRFDEGSGAMAPLGVVAQTPHPAFLAADPSGRFVYAVNESNVNRTNGHTVTAFAVEGEKLRLLDVQPCGGDRPAHVAVDATGKLAFVADYGSGTMAILPIRDDGGLEGPSFVFQDPQPTSPLERQREPHAHGIAFDPSNRFAYCCDLGADKVMIYRIDPAAGQVARADPPSAALPQGFGPRHLAISRDGRQAYVLCEIASKLVVFDRSPSDGSLAQREVVSTVPDGWKGVNTAAEIQLDAAGRFLYTSNRGQDSIATFALGRDGGARLVGTTPCGREPRYFCLDPSGRFLLVANQGADTVRVFSVDPATGRLAATATKVSASMPVTIVFGRPQP
ncbi:MAG TPA: lactonase family protein [Opitutaceae bacterium]|nr:lactonase family protein [Opitutaceae bacterium]